MKFTILFLLMTSSAWSFTLNNNFGAAFGKSKVNVYVAGNSTCTPSGANVTSYELLDLVGPAVDKFWNKVPTSRLRLKVAGFSETISNIVNGRLCSPTDTDCITAAGGALIPAVYNIIISCNVNANNFGDVNSVVAVTIPNNFSGKKIRGSVILINDATGVFGRLSTQDKISVIAHEIGHAIGLGHALDKNKEALMYYRTVNLRRTLGQDDIDGVSYLYPVHVDGCGLFGGTMKEQNGDPHDPPPFWEMVSAMMILVLMSELRKFLKRPQARATA